MLESSRIFLPRTAKVSQWMHLIWIVEGNRTPLFEAKRIPLIRFLFKACQAEDVYLDCANGTRDHLHLLLQLPPDQTVAELNQCLQELTRSWTERKENWGYPVEWSAAIRAYSVSPEKLAVVRRQIFRQAERHQRQSLAQELWELTQSPEDQCLLAGSVEAA
ncbi:MAG: transposase [Bacteroidota bacterium]